MRRGRLGPASHHTMRWLIIAEQSGGAFRTHLQARRRKASARSEEHGYALGAASLRCVVQQSSHVAVVCYYSPGYLFFFWIRWMGCDGRVGGGWRGWGGGESAPQLASVSRGRSLAPPTRTASQRLYSLSDLMSAEAQRCENTRPESRAGISPAGAAALPAAAPPRG